MLPARIRNKLIAVGRLLLNQQEARVLVPPRAAEPGFWFGGGEICRDRDGSLLLCGRYRNGGDSRTGIEAGPRGAELLILRSTDGGRTFGPVLSLLKNDLAPAGEEVLSIEGSCLRVGPRGMELYVSSEKRRAYPAPLRQFQKPGTGVWSIDVLRAPDLAALRGAKVEPALRCDEPARLHLKDPKVVEFDGREFMICSCHPFSWASSNAAVAEKRPDGGWALLPDELLPRGPAWDVAICRVTARMPLPPVGVLKDEGPLSLYFYDGGECMHRLAGERPRGYSCEEIGGLAAGYDAQFPRLIRLSVEMPLFVSPHGTGCSRYVSIFEGEDDYIATWQQSRPDGSQPLVAHRVPRAEVEAVLAG